MTFLYEYCHIYKLLHYWMELIDQYMQFESINLNNTGNLHDLPTCVTNYHNSRPSQSGVPGKNRSMGLVDL